MHGQQELPRNAFPGRAWQSLGTNVPAYGCSPLLTLKALGKYISNVEYRGGKPEKEKALFGDKWKDELCPDPKKIEYPLRDKQPCPDWIYVVQNAQML